MVGCYWQQGHLKQNWMGVRPPPLDLISMVYPMVKPSVLKSRKSSLIGACMLIHLMDILQFLDYILWSFSRKKISMCLTCAWIPQYTHYWLYRAQERKIMYMKEHFLKMTVYTYIQYLCNCKVENKNANLLSLGSSFHVYCALPARSELYRCSRAELKSIPLYNKGVSVLY